MSETIMTRSEEIEYDTFKLPRANCPEEVGIPSDAVRELVESIESVGFRYHSLFILRGGKVAAECHRYPFSPEQPHILYSISKSVTSCAVGLAIQEGYLTLDTSIADVFPEYVPENDAEEFSKIKVRNLLNMTSGKMPSYLSNKTKGEWIRQYAQSKWYAKPGEQFKYVNENPYMLSAMLNRVTGMTVSEFLTPRLWNPLGIRTPYWETDEMGVESGGWGLFLTPEGFAKFTLMIHQRGMFNGKQILPREYVEEAITHQVDTGEQGRHGRKGYGYCFWITNDVEYLASGVFGQIGYARKDMDLSVVVVSGDMHTDPVFDAINVLAAKISDTPLEPQNTAELKEFLSTRKVDVLPEEPMRSPLESEIQNKILWFSKPFGANLIGFPPSVLPVAAVYMTKDRAGNMDRFQFSFREDYALFQWREGDETCCVRLGMDGKYRVSKITLAGTRYTIFGAANWLDESTLEVRVRPVESIGIRFLTFKFSGKRVTMTTESDPPLEEVLGDVRFTVDEMFHTRTGKNIGGMLFDSIKKIAEPVMHGEVLDKVVPVKEDASDEEIAESDEIIDETIAELKPEEQTAE